MVNNKRRNYFALLLTLVYGTFKLNVRAVMLELYS